MRLESSCGRCHLGAARGRGVSGACVCPLCGADSEGGVAGVEKVLIEGAFVGAVLIYEIQMAIGGADEDQRVVELGEGFERRDGRQHVARIIGLESGDIRLAPVAEQEATAAARQRQPELHRRTMVKPWRGGWEGGSAWDAAERMVNAIGEPDLIVVND